MSEIQGRTEIEGVSVLMQRSVYRHSPEKAHVTVTVWVSSFEQAPAVWVKFFASFPAEARVTNDECESPGLLEIMWTEAPNERDLAMYAEEQAAEQKRIADALAYDLWQARRGPIGSSKKRAEVGLPGHCERCAEVGHVAAHPDMGCGDVGCDTSHPDPALLEAEIMERHGRRGGDRG